ncbi:pentatricopeptide repeat-containing protein, mitochondrial [Quillaja saponaria]|uniref:Pentatricopeptide repeat-containing protein, mitochondrial n=1 Tax=Quillaja saponaria TaxID=32244 RepID=A0AAD7KU68_QUISA|nr:pentatricopeptide repeat-containing protein, mitochondrial [Quillaja saponaria]
MASVEQLTSYLLPLYIHSVDRQNLCSLSKVFDFSTNHAFHRTGRTKSCTFKFPDYNDKLHFQEHLSRRPIVKAGFSWNRSLPNIEDANNTIREYVDDGLFENAVMLYLKMLEYGSPVEHYRFFPTLIKAFGGLSDVKKGRQIHGHALKLGLSGEVYIENSLLGMYWKYGEVENAVQLFEKMYEKDVVSWNNMISGYCKLGDYRGSLTVLKHMIRECGLYPNRVACLSALSSASSIQSLILGQEVHGYAVKSGLDVDVFLVSGLIEMYMKCGDVRYAEHVFRSALVQEDVAANTVWTVLVLCSQTSELVIGKQIHGFILASGLVKDVRVETALLDMYFKCGDPETGLKIFFSSKNRNLIMWGSVITNCAQCGNPTEALKLFSNFILEHGFADSILLLAALRSCSSLSLKSRGLEIHALAVKMGIDSDIFVGSALVDFYAKCGDVKTSEKVFHGLTSRDIISWNSLMSSYAQNDCTDGALKAFRDLQYEQIAPNNVTIACLLSVCAHLSILILCMEVHCYVLRRGFESNVLVSNSLIAAYAKCGDMNGSWILFEKMPERTEVSWNSIILSLGIHGRTDEMFGVYEKMKGVGMRPDHATFTALLSACSHGGRVDMGWKYFQSMVEDYKLEPKVEHYTCMVDLLGRAGHLKQAYDLIMSMPCVSDDRIWGSLLGSCKIHGNEKLAELVANHIFKLDPTSIGYHVLLANLYEDFGKWNEVTRIRSKVKDMRLRKQPGCSWIEVNNNVHIFVAGDCSHHQSGEIHSTIESLTMGMRRPDLILSPQ